MTDGGIGISPVPKEARPFQGLRAGVVTRVTAAVIDGLVVCAVLLAIYLGYAGFLFLLDPRNFTFPDPSLILSIIGGLIVLVLYFTVAWPVSGRTYGAHVMGLRVINAWGGRMRPAGALARAVFCALVPIGLLWCAVSRENRSLQDIVLRTSVVYDWQPRPIMQGRPPGRPDHAPAPDA